MLCDPSLYTSNPINITSNEVWIYDDYIFEDIIVNSGYSLTIKCRLDIIDQATITVKKGGKLMDEKDCVNIFLSEGAGKGEIVAEMESNGEDVPRDAFGHVKLDKINPGKWFASRN